MSEIRDSANYREMQEPFDSFDTANKALNGFFDEFRELRNKYKLPDVYVIIAGTAFTAGGDEGEFVTSQMHGNSLRSESLCAWALGQEQVRRQEAIGKLLRGGISKRKAQK